MKRMLAALFAMLIVAGAGAGAQQRDVSLVTIKTTALGHETFMLEGDGGNITVAVGRGGIIMVDGEFAPLHDKIKAAVAAVSSRPIRYLVNTHFHGDHTGGNVPFAKDGALVVAQVNVGKRLAAGTTNGLTGATTPPAPPEALPVRNYLDAMALAVPGRTAQLTYVANAHTDGDTFVVFRDADVISTGDIVSFGRFPNVDFANGGNINGLIDGTNRILGLTGTKTKIVPGHGPLGNADDLRVYLAMLESARDRVGHLIADGKSEADAVAAKPLADYQAQMKLPELAAANFVRVTYHSLRP
jgi:cyclase